MNLEALLSEDTTTRDGALALCERAAEHERSALGAKLGPIAKAAAATLADAPDAGPDAARFTRACAALAALRVETAKSALLRIADEGTREVRAALARALSRARSTEGREVLVYLLSDEEARADAVAAIAAAPWPEVLPALIEIAEADDEAARLSAIAIARIGATAGPDERNAAADFLLEQLDDDALLPAAVEALLRFGLDFPGVAARAKRLAKEPGLRKPAGLCLVAACSDEGNAALIELALAGTKVEEEAARAFLEPLRSAADPRTRGAADRAWRALDLG